jgi:hypothetical protein
MAIGTFGAMPKHIGTTREVSGGDRESSAASYQRIIDVCANPCAASTSDGVRRVSSQTL